MKPNDVAFCAKLLQNTTVPVGTVISFPHGNSVTPVKIEEARAAIQDGALEIDMVLPIGLVRSANFDYVRDEVNQMTQLCHDHKVLLKIIFENCYLNRDEIVRCCEYAVTQVSISSKHLQDSEHMVRVLKISV